MDEAFEQGGFGSTAIDFIAGAVVYTAANVVITRHGAKHRKQLGSNPDESQQHGSEGSGLAIAVGTFLDSIPETVVIGAVELALGPVERRGHARGRAVRGLHLRRPGGIALASGVAVLLGDLVLAGAGREILAMTNAVAAGQSSPDRGHDDP